MTTSLGKLVAHAELRTEAFKKGADDVTRTLGGVEKQGGAARGSMGGLVSTARRFLPALGVGAVVAGFRKIISVAKETAREIDVIAKSARKFSMEASELQAIQKVAEITGVGNIEQSLNRFKRAVSEAQFGDQTATDALGLVGLTAADVASENLADNLKRVADAFAQTESEAAKAAAAFDLFGRNGAEMIPLLEQTSEFLEDMERFQRSEGIGLYESETAEIEKMHDRDSLRGSWWQNLKQDTAVGYAQLKNEWFDMERGFRSFFGDDSLDQIDELLSKKREIEASEENAARLAEEQAAAAERQNKLLEQRTAYMARLDSAGMSSSWYAVHGMDQFEAAAAKQKEELRRQEFFMNLSPQRQREELARIDNSAAFDRRMDATARGMKSLDDLAKAFDQVGLDDAAKAYDDAIRSGISRADAEEIRNRTEGLSLMQERQSLMDRINGPGSPAAAQFAQALIQGTQSAYNASIRPNGPMETLVDLQRKANELTQKINETIGKALPTPYDLTTGSIAGN